LDSSAIRSKECLSKLTRHFTERTVSLDWIKPLILILILLLLLLLWLLTNTLEYL